MESITSLFAEHGLLALWLGVFAEQLGAPVPAMPFLMLAGVASASDAVFAVKALAVASLASMLADLIWFVAGRRFGRRVLALLCRISISPDSCVRQSELSFARRGVATLVVAKFIPGLSTLASPLAGAIGMRSSSFLLFNLAGTLLWAGSGIVGGLVFHDQVEALLQRLSDLGATAVIVAASLLAVYIAARLWRRWRVARSMAKLPRLQPWELAQQIERGDDIVVVDVRVALAQLEQRIPGARRVELASLETIVIDDWPPAATIVTYCSCPDDASALKAAHLLSKRGRSVGVLSGGIDGWTEAGYPLEAGEA